MTKAKNETKDSRGSFTVTKVTHSYILNAQTHDDARKLFLSSSLAERERATRWEEKVTIETRIVERSVIKLEN